MREFFRGWRRKVGCATLAIAIAFCAGLIRSYSHYDQLCCPIWSGQDAIISFRGAIGWMSIATQSDLQDLSFWQRLSFATLEAGHKEVNLPEILAAIDKIDKPSGHQPEYSIVHYWHIVLPLTLLSAYLILWKPRKRVPAPMES